MNLPSLILLITLSLSAPSKADDLDRVEESKSLLISFYAVELRDAHQDGFFAKNRTDSEVDQLISQISAEVATCWIDGYLRLAKSKSIPIADVFVSTPGIINTDLFAYGESNEATNHCVPEAFQKAGVEY